MGVLSGNDLAMDLSQTTMALTPNDPASGINVRTYLAAAGLAGRMSKDIGFTAEDAALVVKAADLVIAELNRGAIAGSTGSIGAASSTGNKTLNVTPRIPDLR